VTTATTTDQATEILTASLHMGGEPRTDGLMREAHRYARREAWLRCGLTILKAYDRLGATPPRIGEGDDQAMAHGYAFYRGDHPIQATWVSGE
jgi:hypothetical protein